MTSDTLLLAIGAVAFVALSVLWLWPRSPVRSAKNLIRRIEAGERPSATAGLDHDFEIVLTDGGFEVRSVQDPAEKAVKVSWERITEANAYKQDLFSTDQVCIAFTMDDENRIVIHEHMRGFSGLCEMLPVALPGSIEFSSWYMNITTPAFERCDTKLFVRDFHRLSVAPDFQ